jgi:pilus assembly protein Flp/PilA
MNDLMHRVNLRAFARERAQGMVEYGLILVLVAIACIAGLLILGPKLSSGFSTISSSV